jgi:hypothetical protein
MEALITGGVAGGLIAVALGAIKLAELRKNGKPNGKFTLADRATLNQIDRWTVSHDACAEKTLEQTEEQTKILRDVRDSLRDVCRDIDKDR